MIDYQVNGLHVRRLDKVVLIEVINECELQRYVEMGKFETVAQAQFAEKMAKLICAGVTAAVPVSTIMGTVSMINGKLQELGVPDRQPHRECRSFGEDIPPGYQFSFYDASLNGVVSGQVGLYAELHRHKSGFGPEESPYGSATDRPGQETD